MQETIKTAWFRFYEELNDFLPSTKKKILFPCPFKGNPSVKDIVESLGVPHPEVDLILVNSNSVDFSYKRCDKDHVSVYPVFESLNITGVTYLRARPLRMIRFIADVHLGKLTKYLRLCGFDTYYDKNLDDREIIELSLSGKRIILTRDRNLLKNRNVTHGYWIRSSVPAEQMRELFVRFDLKDNMKPFTRCTECNSLLVKVNKEDIIDRLLPKTRQFYDTFKRCPGCGRIYWEGAHFDKMRQQITSFQSQVQDQ